MLCTEGTTAEKVLYNVLIGHSEFEDIEKETETTFRQRTTMLGTEEEKIKEIKDLVGYKTYGAKRKDGTKPIKNEYKGFIKNAYDRLKVYGKPESYQQRVWFKLPQFEVFADGYKDFGYEDFDLDLKTTSKMSWRVTFSIQTTTYVYRMQSNKDQKLLLATKDKAELYVLEDSYNQSKEEINDIINTMATLLPSVTL